MDFRFSRPMKILSTIVLAFFMWTFGGIYEVVFAATRTQSSEYRSQTKAKKAEEKFEEAIEGIEGILEGIKDKGEAEVETEKEKIKQKKLEIEALDIEIRQKFRETEERIKDLPEEIKQRHRDFVRKYEESIKELKAHLDAIERAKGKAEVEAEVEKAKAFLEKVKPPKKHVPLDPNKLPHRTAEPTEKKPRLKKEEFGPQSTQRAQREDSRQYAVGSKQRIKDSRQYGVGSKQEPILVASAGPLIGLLDSPLPTTYNPQPVSNSLPPTTYNLQPISSSPPPNTYNPQPVLLAQADPPTDADLAETIEVQFTPEIQAKALELENNPVRIYNWVRNNIEFVPTYGSIQGADMCLQTKQCNAFDTASLLIALLRASNIPARYVYGTVEIPIEKVMNWVGNFTDPNAVLKFIASGGIPITGLATGDKIVAAQMEHVWVEAYVDYIPYRGAVKGPGDTWIPLDASFKQYNYHEGIDVDTAVPTDFEALLDEVESQSVINTEIPYITSIPSETIQNQVADFQTRLNEYLAANFPQVDTYYELSKTLHGHHEIVKKELRFLPNTLASMKVIAELDTFSELPEGLRHKISFNLSSLDLLGGGTPLSYTASLPEIAGKRITLSYIPATTEDAQVMSNAQGILDFPLYLVKVIPELKIEGQAVATGGSIGMGLKQSFQIAFSNLRGMTDRVTNTIYAGEYYAVGLDVNKVTFPYLYDRVNRWQPDTAEDRDDRLGELLYLVAMFYFAKSDFFMDELSKSSDIVSLRHPSESMVGMKFDASYLFGTPMTITSVGLNIDVDRDVISAVSKTNSSDTRFWFMVQNGLYASGLEHSLFESLMELDAISAVRFLDLASAQSIPIYIVDSENSQRVDELVISSRDKQDIMSYINAGKMVLVPKTEIQYFDYSGIGYAAIDQDTGAGAYMISGGYSGGETVKENVEALLDLAIELIGEKREWVYSSYETTIEYLLATYPDIADSPDEKFKKWTEEVLFVGEYAKGIGDPRIRVIIGQIILYSTEIMLLQLTIP